MAYWADSSIGDKDPKRQFRWIMRINSIPAYVLKKVSKPSFTVAESAHKFLNHTYYYPGRVEWQEISVTLADPVNEDMASTVVNIVDAAGYKPKNSGDVSPESITTMSKSTAVNSLGQNVQIVQVDSQGRPVETWTLKNAWVKDVNFGELDYEGDDLTNVELKLRYDWASLETANPGAPGNPTQEAGVGPYWPTS
jgi:hypothetical protein